MVKLQHFFSILVLFLIFVMDVNAQNTTAIYQPITPTIPTIPNQEKCGTSNIHDRLLLNDPVYRQNFEDIQRAVETQLALNPPDPSVRAPLLTVPIVFHVMHLGEAEGTGTNISYEQLLAAVASLNDAYRGLAPYNSSGVDMEIEFCLASQDPSGNPTNGVNRIDASGTSDYAANGLTTSGTNNEVAIKALSKWPNTDYYNIWVVSEIDGNNAGGGTQGFAYFPGAGSSVDGTVIMYNSIGYDPTGARCLNVKSFTNYNITFIHELGHAFGLYHTFEGDVNGTVCPPNGSCTTQGDRVCDTPPHDRTSGCPTGTNNLCGTLRDNHMHNFMDYSSDICQTEFTNDQKTRARGFLTGSRASLLTSVGCTPVAAPISDFTTECAGPSIAGCTGSSVQFYDLSSRTPSSWSWTFPGGTPGTSTAQNPNVSYAVAGTYAVTLVASNAFGTGTTETKTGYITIYDSPTAACTPGIQNTGFFGYSFSNVSFNNIDNNTAPATNGPQDFSCTQTTCVTEGQSYTLSITVGNSGGQNGFYDCFIDYNDDGTFSAGESILSGSTTAGSGYQTFTQSVLIPTNAVEGDLLRMRVINDQFNLSGPCDNLFTGESEDYGIYISTAAAITTQPLDASACAGNNATFTVAATGAVTFQWQEDNGGGFVNITNGGIYSGATTASLTLTGVTAPMNGHDYRCIIGNGCDQSVTSNAANLTIGGGLSFTTQPSDQTGCAGDTENFTVVAPSATTHQWQEDNGGGFVNITNGGIYSGATSATLTLTGITAPMNGYLYRCLVSDGSCNGTSNTANLTVTAAPTISTQPTAQAGCVGDTENFTCVAASGTYQWQEDNGGGFVNITNGGIYSGATASTLTLTGVTAPMNGYVYRCIVTSGCSVTSNTAILTVNSPPTITTQPTNQAGCVSATEIFTVAASGGTFQWQEDNGGGFVNVTNGGIYSGATTNSLTLTGITAPMNGYLYRCVVTLTDCSSTSNNALLTVNPSPSITTQPTAQAGCVGDTENFNCVAASGTYQWQEDNGGGFVNISNGGIYSGATAATLTLTGITAPMNGYVYRCVVTDLGCNVNSNPAILTVNSPPTITTQPTNQAGCVSATEIFTVAASGGTFQWQEDNGGGFVNVTNGGIYSGATTNSLTLTGITAPMNGYLYRCVVTLTGCSSTSNNALLTVNPSPSITTQPTAQAGCVGDTENFNCVAASGTYQWQEDNGGGFVNISNGGIYSGATTATLTLTGITAPMNGYVYRCVVTDLGCNVNSNTAILTVTSPPTISTQPLAQSGCAGDTENFTIAVSSGTLQWQEDNGGGFVNITNGGIYSGATTATLTLTGTTAPMNGYLYRCVISDGTCVVNSNAVGLTVNTTVAISTQPSNASVCLPGNAAFNIVAPTALTYQWQEDNGGGFVNVTNGGIYSGATSATLNITGVTAPMNGYLYRCIVTNGACNNTSVAASLTVGAGPSISTNLITPTTSECENNSFSLTIVASGASSYQWYEFNGVSWSALVDAGIYSGTSTATLNFTNPPNSIDGYQYYCNVISACGNTESDTTSLSLIQVTRQPVHQVGSAGDTTFFVSTSINETCGTTWEVNNGSGWTTLTPNVTVYPYGINADTLAVIVSTGLDANWYRRVACGASCSLASDSAQVSIILFSNVRGNMYEFDGVDDYIAVDTTPLGASNSQDISYSFEAWVYPDDIATRQTVIGNHNYAGSFGTALDISGGQARFFKQEAVDVVAGAINASEWSHLAGTYDEVTDELRLYINGVLIGTATSTQADAGGPHNIGTHSGNGAVPLSDFFNGKMDEVRIWNVVRTQTEIREAMHRSLDGSEPGLMLYYQFDRDKTAGTTFGVRDALGKSHSTAQLPSANYAPSQVHVGGGTSNSQTIVGTGNVIFTGTNLEINFPVTHPNGEVVVTRVVTENAYAPPLNAPFETGYWVVNNFGTVNTALAATPLFRYNDGAVTSALLGEFTLYKRPSRDFGAWPQTFTPATTADNTAGNNHCSFSGINDFSVLVPTNNTLLLATDFLFFQAQANNNREVLLSWEIENEANNLGFDVERSADGVLWEKIGFVNSLNTPTTYTLLDENPIVGQNYYRLKVIDFNNQTSYSDIQTVAFSVENQVWVYPNPNNGVFQIDFEAQADYYAVEVYDAVGRKILAKVLNANKNSIDLSSQAAGMYALVITIGEVSHHTKVIVSH